MGKGNRLRALLFATLLAFSAAGCGDSRVAEKKYEIELKKYEKIQYLSVPVSDEPINSHVELRIEAVDSELKQYRAAKDEMEISSFNLAKGDMVEEGQVLIEFRNDEIDEELEKYSNALEEDRLLLNHVIKMVELGAAGYTEEDISIVQNNISVSEAYIEDLNARRAEYNVVAPGTGMVVSVSDNTTFQKVQQGNDLFSVMYGQGEYIGTLSENPGVKVGDVYQGTYTTLSYDMEVIDIDESAGNCKLKFRYKSVDGEIPASLYLDMKIEHEPIVGKVHLPEEYLLEYAGKNYVVVLGESGYGVKKEVTVENCVGGEAIISSGVSAGEKVIKK